MTHFMTSAEMRDHFEYCHRESLVKAFVARVNGTRADYVFHRAMADYWQEELTAYERTTERHHHTEALRSPAGFTAALPDDADRL
jgi:hypothetical protein